MHFRFWAFVILSSIAIGANLPHISFKITSSAQQSSFNCSVSSCHCGVGKKGRFQKKKGELVNIIISYHFHTLGLGIPYILPNHRTYPLPCIPMSYPPSDSWGSYSKGCPSVNFCWSPMFRWYNFSLHSDELSKSCDLGISGVLLTLPQSYDHLPFPATWRGGLQSGSCESYISRTSSPWCPFVYVPFWKKNRDCPTVPLSCGCGTRAIISFSSKVM